MVNRSSVIVRFAPSPTGPLHIGGLRTAVFNWLFARHAGGRFLLRIEDTDSARSEQRFTDGILWALDWLGLDRDAPPVFQSQNQERHRRDVVSLIEAGKAYPCFCSREALEFRRNGAPTSGQWMYDRTCLSLPPAERAARIAAGVPHVIRLEVPAGETCWSDLVHGNICVRHQEVEDFVLLRQDGSPTYQMAVVSDDHAMQVTHVIRGDDHISNTPKQILLYQALGFDVPVFAHIPLIFGVNRKKLSKRHGPVSVDEYAAKGYLPEALLNFLALLGWNPGDDTELMNRAVLVERFSFEGVSRSNAVFDEQKLVWMNGQYIAQTPVSTLLPLVLTVLQHYQWPMDDTVYIEQIIALLQSRAHTIPEFAAFGGYFFEDPADYEEKARKKYWKDPAVSGYLQQLHERFAVLPDFQPESLETALRALAAESGATAAQLIHPVRLAVSGMSVTPDVFAVLSLLGRERVLRRLQKAVLYLAAFPEHRDE